MIDDRQRPQALDEIGDNIAPNGQNIDWFFGGTCPRFAYTSGVSEFVGVELTLAGAIPYLRNDLAQIIRNTVARLTASRDRELVEIAGRRV